ncbi:MAG: hypothetical protein ACREA0_03020, partial [bacterium]
IQRNLKPSLLALAVLLVACGGGGGEEGDASIAGTYNCGMEGEAPQDVLELREDRTLTFTPGALPGAPPDAPPPEEGTWSLEGNAGTFQFQDFQDRFTIEGDRLTFAHAGAPEGEETVCTRAS